MCFARGGSYCEHRLTLDARRALLASIEYQSWRTVRHGVDPVRRALGRDQPRRPGVAGVRPTDPREGRRPQRHVRRLRRYRRQGFGRGRSDGGRGFRQDEHGMCRSRSSPPTIRTSPTSARPIARQWYDRDGVDAILDVPTSSVALAVSQVTREKNKVFIDSGAGDHGTDRQAMLAEHDPVDLRHLRAGARHGRRHAQARWRRWYFLTADYAFGLSLQSEATAVVGRRAAGGSWARPASRSRPPISPRSCCRPRPRARRWWAGQCRRRHDQRDQAGARIRPRPRAARSSPPC